MLKIALIVARNYQELSQNCTAVDEAKLLQRVFKRIGVAASLHSYCDPEVEWANFDAVVPKAVWDYFQDPGGFMRWLDTLTGSGVRSINDAALVKWNHDKAYLTDLRGAGARVAPFLHFPAGADPAGVMPRIIAEGWDRIVVSPSISVGGWRTLETDLSHGTDIEALARDVLSDCPLLAQPYFEEIKEHGEWSVLFIEGEPTHAVRKFPRPGHYRSQPIWDWVTEPVDAPDWLLDAARKAVYAAPSLPVYGRVDGFVRDGQLHLMELDLIEPYFFFEHAPYEVVMQFSEAVVGSLLQN